MESGRGHTAASEPNHWHAPLIRSPCGRPVAFAVPPTRRWQWLDPQRLQHKADTHAHHEPPHTRVCAEPCKPTPDNDNNPSVSACAAARTETCAHALLALPTHRPRSRTDRPCPLVLERSCALHYVAARALSPRATHTTTASPPALSSAKTTWLIVFFTHMQRTCSLPADSAPPR